ncbi:M56 family metallopeptidase [Agathobaculum sp. NTUH-O15-33]|uniref:M56 family metallopeptidase n=1 Tax=Agathobaculum sp. NTUH-O15-33 TaxID=3079302 RepID=UPI00295839F1|nr:M56 family metallopeptidase [Agathobaculum sp. NTUH-O15-33]WNX85277.1 M56 family metallopeptidase [Agathobaculum sp. NTUH-O15-33]
MKITLFSFFSAIFWSGILIIAIYFLRKTQYKRYFGMFTIVLLYLFCAVRMFFPLEFSHVYIINDQTVYPQIYKALTSDGGFGTGISLLRVVGAVEISVFAFLLIRYIANYHKALKTIKRYAALVRSERTQDILGEIKRLTKKNLDVSVLTVSNIDTPFGFGIFRKMILLPRKDYTDEELRYILLHEYTHLINRDILVKLLVSLFCMFFWWFPVSHLLKRDLEQTLEIKCDLSVSNHLNMSERASYLQTIVNTLNNNKSQNTLPYAATALLAGRKNTNIEVRERFKMVTNYGTGRIRHVINVLIVCVFGLLLILSYSVISQPSFEAPESTEPDAVDFDPSNAYIQREADGYWLYIDDIPQVPIKEDEAEFYRNLGFTIIESGDEK